MKKFQWSWMVMVILALALSAGCGKKTVSSEAVPYTPAVEERKPAEMKEEAKVEPVSPDKAAEEKRIQEETLREQAMREKALKEKAMAEASAREAALKGKKLTPIYFDFDQAVILDSQRPTLGQNADWLKANPQAKIRIEGHCDERGTSEYNLALGQKRAEAAKRFLEGLGISPQRMTTISYGEERPAVEGHTEEAWAKNRRDEFVLAP